MAVQVSTEVSDGVGIIEVAGEVDAANASELRDAFMSALSSGANGLVIDCAELTFIDSTGISALIAANRAATDRSGSVTLRNPSPLVLRLLRVTGLEDRLVIEP